jgi:hypothetical protein
MGKYMKNPEFKGKVVLPNAVKQLHRHEVVEGEYAELVAAGKLVAVEEGAVPAVKERKHRTPSDVSKTHAGKIAAGLVKGPVSAEKQAARDAARPSALKHAKSKSAALKAAVVAKAAANKEKSAAVKAAKAAKAAAKAAKAPKAPVAAAQ